MHDISPLPTPTPSPVASPTTPTIDVATTSPPASSTAAPTNSEPNPNGLAEDSAENLAQASAQTETDPLSVMPEQPQQPEIAPQATTMPELQASMGPLPQTVTQPPQEPSPESRGSESRRPDDEAASMPTTGPQPLDLSPTERLTRDRGLDDINNERNFREVSKEMERIFRDA